MQIVLARVLLGGIAPLVVESGIEVHAAGVQPDEEGFPIRLGLVDELEGGRNDLLAVEIFHPLLGQRARVGTLLLADFAKARFDRLVFGAAGVAVQHTTCAELLVILLG